MAFQLAGLFQNGRSNLGPSHSGNPVRTRGVAEPMQIVARHSTKRATHSFLVRVQSIYPIGDMSPKEYSHAVNRGKPKCVCPVRPKDPHPATNQGLDPD